MRRLQDSLYRAKRLINTLKHLKIRQLFFMGVRRGIQFPYRLPTTIGARKQNFRLHPSPHNSHCAQDNRLVFLNATSPFLIGDVRWRAESMSKLWRYNLHYFDYLASDIEAQTKNFLIQNWIENNPYPCEDAWEPYPTSLRIINWIKYFQQQKGKHISSAWISSLYAQGHFLTHHIEWHIDANHLLKNIIALTLWSHFFSDPYAQHWQNRSFNLLKTICSEQFNTDGGHYERSPMYHHILLYHLLDAYNCLKINSDVALDGLLKIIKDALQYCQIIAQPDASFPLSKDSAYGIAPTLKDLMQYADQLDITIERLALEEPQTYLLAQSGYFIKKSHSDFLLFDIGNVAPSHQPGHAHCDALHVELYISGRSIFTDSGVFCYAASEQRDYSRSVRAHNTLSINSREQHELWGEFRIGKRGHTFNVQNDANFCSAEFKPYWATHNCNISHKRSILAENLSCVEIVDLVQGVGIADIESRWHIAPGLAPRLVSGDIHISDMKNILVAVIKLQHNQVISTITQSDLYSEFGLRVSRYCLTFTQAAAELPWKMSLQIQTVDKN